MSRRTEPSLPEGTYSSMQVCEMARITYRQLNYWTNHGYIKPEYESRGSGDWRYFTEDEAGAVVEVAKLVRQIENLRSLLISGVAWDIAMRETPLSATDVPTDSDLSTPNM